MYQLRYSKYNLNFYQIKTQQDISYALRKIHFISFSVEMFIWKNAFYSFCHLLICLFIFTECLRDVFCLVFSKPYPKYSHLTFTCFIMLNFISLVRGMQTAATLSQSRIFFFKNRNCNQTNLHFDCTCLVFLIFFF